MILAIHPQFEVDLSSLKKTLLQLTETPTLWHVMFIFTIYHRHFKLFVSLFRHVVLYVSMLPRTLAAYKRPSEIKGFSHPLVLIHFYWN